MRSRIIVGAFLLFGLLAAGTIAASGDGVAPPRQWAITNFIDPVLVADRILMGPYLIVHDDTKMARQTTIAGLGIKQVTEYQFALDGEAHKIPTKSSRRVGSR